MNPRLSMAAAEINASIQAEINTELVRRAYRVRYAQVLPSITPGMVRLRIGKGEFKLLSVSEALHMLRMAKRRERVKRKGKKP